MKAVLVVELDDDINLDDVEIRYAIQNMYGMPIKAEVDGARLRPLPKKKAVAMTMYENHEYKQGFNACLDEITGETE